MTDKVGENGNLLHFGLAARRRNNIALPETLLDQDSFVTFAAQSCGITLTEAHEAIEDCLAGFEHAFKRIDVKNKGVIYSLALMSCYYGLFAEDIPEDLKPSLRDLLFYSLGQACDCSMAAGRPAPEDAKDFILAEIANENKILRDTLAEVTALLRRAQKAVE